MKCPTEIAISDRREFELSNLGFLPLLHSKGNDFAVFMGAQSCQKPKTYFDAAANANAELSAKFNLILSTSRFAHYLKVMARDKIGSFMEVGQCGVWLNNWINKYVLANPELVGDEEKAKKPLADAKVNVRAVAGQAGFVRGRGLPAAALPARNAVDLDATGRRGPQESLSDRPSGGPGQEAGPVPCPTWPWFGDVAREVVLEGGSTPGRPRPPATEVSCRRSFHLDVTRMAGDGDCGFDRDDLYK